MRKRRTLLAVAFVCVATAGLQVWRRSDYPSPAPAANTEVAPFQIGKSNPAETQAEVVKCPSAAVSLGGDPVCSPAPAALGSAAAAEELLGHLRVRAGSSANYVALSENVWWQDLKKTWFSRIPSAGRAAMEEMGEHAHSPAENLFLAQAAVDSEDHGVLKRLLQWLEAAPDTERGPILRYLVERLIAPSTETTDAVADLMRRDLASNTIPDNKWPIGTAASLQGLDDRFSQLILHAALTAPARRESDLPGKSTFGERAVQALATAPPMQRTILLESLLDRIDPTDSRWRMALQSLAQRRDTSDMGTAIATRLERGETVDLELLATLAREVREIELGRWGSPDPALRESLLHISQWFGSRSPKEMPPGALAQDIRTMTQLTDAMLDREGGPRIVAIQRWLQEAPDSLVEQTLRRASLGGAPEAMGLLGAYTSPAEPLGIRLAASTSLGENGPAEDAIRTLSALAEADTSSAVRAAAVGSLGVRYKGEKDTSRRSRIAQEGARLLLNERSDEVRGQIIEMLRSCEEEVARSALAAQGIDR